MKPGDHPEFFRFPAPEGRSRESTIRLDREGHFHHDGELVSHLKLSQAMHGWIAKHPDDGRYILTNGYDWTYFTVDDAPYYVRSVEESETGLTLVLSDGGREALEPDDAWLDDRGAVTTHVKRDVSEKGGPFVAKFDRHAMTALAPYLVEAGERGEIGLRLGDRVVALRGRTG